MYDKTKLAYTEGIASVIINTLLFALKLWAGTITGSIAVIADAWHTLSDSITSVILIFGAKSANKPPDKEHPFGHGRAELITSIIIGVLLSVVGINFITESAHRLISRERSDFSFSVLVVMSVSVVLKEGLAQFSFWAYRKTGSMALKADGWHHRSDSLASLLIVTGIFISRYFWWIDAVLGLIVSLIIIISAIAIIREGAAPLLGESPDKVLIGKINKLVSEIIGSENHLHHLHLHRYGHHTEMTFHICLPGDKTVEEGHEAATKIENLLRERLNIEATIHVEPFKS
ncbi:MAG: cation diffusion facilitator family transporter [Spirochaetia bacterium]|jgi:cation diffusion facilitator family transporter|nr:cation diffusion facilitator family transporter [Spirochaetia bacterium]